MRPLTTYAPLEPEALAIKREAVAQRIAIEPVVGGIITSNAVFVARSVVSPPRHSGARYVAQFFAKEAVQRLNRGEGVALELVELDVEEAVIVARIAEGDHPLHPQF